MLTSPGPNRDDLLTTEILSKPVKAKSAASDFKSEISSKFHLSSMQLFPPAVTSHRHTNNIIVVH